MCVWEAREANGLGNPQSGSTSRKGWACRDSRFTISSCAAAVTWPPTSRGVLVGGASRTQSPLTPPCVRRPASQPVCPTPQPTFTLHAFITPMRNWTLPGEEASEVISYGHHTKS